MADIQPSDNREDEREMITSKFFNMGRVFITKGIDKAIRESDKFAIEVNLSLQRYAVKDWGNLGTEDKQTNDEALNYPDDLYILGAYQTSKGKSILSQIEFQKRQEITQLQFVSQKRDKRESVDCLKYGSP